MGRTCALGHHCPQGCTLPQLTRAFVHYCLLPPEPMVRGQKLPHSTSRRLLLFPKLSSHDGSGSPVSRAPGLSSLSIHELQTAGHCFLTSFPLLSLEGSSCAGSPANLPSIQEIAAAIFWHSDWYVSLRHCLLTSRTHEDVVLFS